MADSYDVNGVTVSPVPGGYYDLTHPSIEGGVERVQGKDKADSRAGEIAAAHEAAGGDAAAAARATGGNPLGEQGGARGGSEDGETKEVKGTDGTTMTVPKAAATPTTDGQVDGDPRTPAQKGLERQAADRGAMPSQDPGGDDRTKSSDPNARRGVDDDKDGPSELEEMRSRMAAMQDMLEKLTGAGHTIASVISDNNPPDPAVPALGSRHFNGEMRDEDRKMLKKAGIETRTIVLEENDNIPPTGLFIGHNGKSYVIKPGEEVEVPKFLTDVLDDAVMAAPIVDSATQKVLGYRNRSRYPYRVVKG